jgi:RNA polymerase sigma-70 factor (ECF subfamily)
LSAARTFLEQISDHVPDLRRYARSLRRQRDQADDLEQDCIERALSKSHLYEEGTNLRAWLITMMRNIAITQMRREASQQRSVLYYGAPRLRTVQADQDLFVELKESLALTRKLPASERRVVAHMCLDDLGYPETSRRTGQPIGTIKSRLSRARRRLRAAAMDPETDRARSGARARRPPLDQGGAEMRSTA